MLFQPRYRRLEEAIVNWEPINLVYLKNLVHQKKKIFSSVDKLSLSENLVYQKCYGFQMYC